VSSNLFPTTVPLPTWLRVLVRLDFVAAVVLTVLIPLALLERAVRVGRTDELWLLLRYWRASSLLLVTVYLLAGERREAFPAGVAARLLIAQTLLRSELVAGEDTLLDRWRQTAGWYCLAGATLTAPMLQGLVANELPPLCRAYIEPTQEFAALLHPRTTREQLGRAGLVGLALFAAGAVVAWLAALNRSAVGQEGVGEIVGVDTVGNLETHRA
jgi:hypothetical protein